jgi:hypothetical protein
VGWGAADHRHSEKQGKHPKTSNIDRQQEQEN